MRFASIVALAALTASASASRYFTCSTGPLSSGVLEIVKNGNETTRLTLAADGSLIRTPSYSQDLFYFVPCTSKFAGHPATTVSKGTGKVMAYGRVLPVSSGRCLTRETASGKILTKPCIALDNSQQLWNVTLVSQSHGDEATGESTLGFVAPGFYPQLMNGQVYQAKSKPVSNWDLRFIYSDGV
ncbi:hypothetical protein EXIGLDRAFT_704916 [Exidia glandulosa HHB12029]|uniref:Ricin B lectin domain-containing protein n=1 Tax=Exidia glandulosa HHB12029 TaxID=1314781 RepID=A0A165KQW6_EXIGL|nr:hypothetical protein EXIGLDRAFT_704916 [Exidia glandulosa HHB12029]